MKAMMRRATRSGTRLAATPHVWHPRVAGVLLEDAREIGELSLGPTITDVLTGDDDADWMRARDSGDEAVGGSTATPDQDIVDEIGRALGVEQEPDAEVWTSREILRERDRHRWQQED